MSAVVTSCKRLGCTSKDQKSFDDRVRVECISIGGGPSYATPVTNIKNVSIDIVLDDALESAIDSDIALL